jgi:hypothetical protein
VKETPAARPDAAPTPPAPAAASIPRDWWEP